MLTNFLSPLRYPGGKSRISNFLEDIILLNNLENCTFYELYAGGAGAAFNLLLSGIVKRIVLNDLDNHIYSFWYSVIYHTEELVKMINDAEVNLNTWGQQQNIYINESSYSTLEVGFSTFFLNRSNRSGILYKAGPIGGKEQNGTYKMDVRFNKSELVRRIKNIALHSSRITLHKEETIDLLQQIFDEKKDDDFIFLDPPYYAQGENLYLNSYTADNHKKLKELLVQNKKQNWFLTYDNCPEIQFLYSDFRTSELPMTYTLQNKRKSKEIMVFSEALSLPRTMRIGKKSSSLALNL